ncbi:autotransporter domain-containing protein [Fulvimonas sp. R45]|uniref:autotransporter domain-containing protein n=1 Tax=Fulvimonas sp. R45 TaxID=3045937 RepID=UPI00265D634B|nr:autotransporter domain-containing protein [Fulvimonas sp. R45]MDO1527872.1 autotransporter domain-containing protein [Fulvimonas sp. R45]
MSDVKHGSRPRAVAFAVALALGLSGCGGGGGAGANVRPSPTPSGDGGFAGGHADVDAGHTVVWSEDIGGSIDLIKGGAGTLVLTGSGSYTGGTTIDQGTLQLGNGGTTGMIVGDVTDHGTLAFDRSDDIEFAGIVSGNGGLTKAGSGALVLIGANGYTGTTEVDAGSLYVDGNQSAATGSTIVGSGATLGGAGSLGGSVNLADGATLAPGSKAAIGTLTIGGDLHLSAGSMLDYDFGQASAAGGQPGDLTYVKGDLTLDGTLNVSVAPGSDLGPGVHRLFNYDGVLVDNGLALGKVPSGWVVQVGVAQQVNLIDTSGMAFDFWDGDAGPKGNDVVNGGNGTWQNGASGNDWTDAGGAVNAPYGNGSFAVFQGAAGVVTVDGSHGGIDAAGMQFASDGYVVQGDVIRLVGSVDNSTHSIIRVGDGTAAGAGYKATINSVLGGDTALVKTDLGTLVLGGADTYTGGTTISDGTLQVGNGGTTGSILGDVMDNASLAFNRSDDVAFNGTVSGTGSLVQSGSGKLVLTGASTYAGGTEVTGGTLEVAPGAALGAGDITVGNDNGSYGSSYTLQVDQGGALSNRIVLKGYGVLDNAGALGGDVGTGVEGENSYLARNRAVLNHDGGSIVGNNAGVMLDGSSATVKNSSGGVIEGGNVGVGLGYGGSVVNDGVGSIIRSSNGLGIQALFEQAAVQNTGGGIISGATAAVDLQYGGTVTNDGAGSTISSADGFAIQVMGETATVRNTGGAVITGGSTALYLQHGGSVTNGSGSVIETAGTTSGDCSGTGDCAIFVASDGQTAQSAGGELTLVNAGTIIGNVQMIPTASNSVTLSAGGSIRGNLDIGSRNDSSLTLDGDAGSVQLYSQAVTGVTTFAGRLNKGGDGTWIIDNDDLVSFGTAVDGGILQIGNGGTEGSVGSGDITLYHGRLVFDRSDDVVFGGNVLGGGDAVNDGTLVQAGTGTLTLLTSNVISPPRIEIDHGTLQIDNTGGMPAGSCMCSGILDANVLDNGALAFNSDWSLFFYGLVSGTGSVTQNGSGDVILLASNTYSGGTTINHGLLQASAALPGDVTINEAGTLDGYSGATLHSGVPGVAGNLSNAGRMLVHAGNSTVGGDYAQASTGTLAVNLGSKLDVAGKATLNGGTLEVTGADSGYVSNTHTDVLTAAGGVTGTFDTLVKDSGVVFTATTINYDAKSVWLDTTGLDVTLAAAGHGVSYTAASMGSARRVQGAFEQLDQKIASDKLSSVPSDFVQAAGQFQQAPTLQSAQASLQSLSGQLHAASAAMTFEAIDASSRALSDHFDSLLDKRADFGMWTQSLNVGGDMERSGFAGVGFQLNGWLLGSDRRIGRSGVAGFAFGQSQGQQRLSQGLDHDNSRSTEGMLYAGWLDGHWYTQGRVGFGHFQQDIGRQLLLGYSMQGVSTRYNGSYGVAHEESGLHFDRGGSHVTPFVDVQYARVDRDGFVEQGAGGFGLRSKAQTLDRWEAGLGVRTGHRWAFDDGRTVEVGAHAQWQRSLASHGDVFEASFVGLEQWQPLLGIGLSRYSGLFGVKLDAMLSARTVLNFGYDYETGQHNHAQMLSARLSMAF